MARARRPNEPSSYEAQPTVPPELQKRFDVIRSVLGNQRTISDAAEELGIARVNMQTLVHRVEGAIVEALQPKPTGRAPKSDAQKQLEQLTKENEKLKAQLQAADDMMMAAGEIIRHLRGMPPSSPRSQSTRSSKSPKAKPEDEPEQARPTTSTIAGRALAHLEKRSSVGVRAASMLSIGLTTLTRWLTRLAGAQPLVMPRGGVLQPGPPESEAKIRALVKTQHGAAGASSLAKSVSGVSRRRAAQLKDEVVTAEERTRKTECRRVEVLQPGIIRGFDAMHLRDAYALIAADGCVPYRTSARRVERYDANHVAAVLADDFRQHGAPLVLRYDRAICHTAPPVMSVLEQYGVMPLQGPAYYAPYYGQHERQNREHRSWCSWLEDELAPSQAQLDEMKRALNSDWLRPTLGWRSAAQCWETRTSIHVDRDELRREVEDRAKRLCCNDVEPDLAMRLAIEQALIAKGLIRITPGRKALCD
jgi:hypothetical protein